MTRAARTILVGFLILAVFYLLGGRESIRYLRARWGAFQQPPTVDQLRAPVEPAIPLRATLPRNAVRGKMWLSDPPKPVSIAVVLAAILVTAVLAMYITGRVDDREAGVRF
jgi:hypothetical protein